MYISQEALGPSKHAEKEFCEDPPGDSCGNGVSLGKETVPSQEDVVGFLVHSVPRGCFITPLRLGALRSLELQTQEEHMRSVATALVAGVEHGAWGLPG